MTIGHETTNTKLMNTGVPQVIVAKQETYVYTINIYKSFIIVIKFFMLDACKIYNSNFEEVSRDSCDHMLSMYYTKSTMNKNFPRIRLRKCEQCPYLTRYAVPSFGQCIWDLENLGWQSR